MMTDKEKHKWFLHGFRASTTKLNGETTDEVFLESRTANAFAIQLDADNAFPLDATAKSLLHVTEEEDRQTAIEVNEKRLAALKEKAGE